MIATGYREAAEGGAKAPQALRSSGTVPYSSSVILQHVQLVASLIQSDRVFAITFQGRNQVAHLNVFALVRVLAPGAHFVFRLWRERNIFGGLGGGCGSRSAYSAASSSRWSLWGACASGHPRILLLSPTQELCGRAVHAFGRGIVLLSCDLLLFLLSGGLVGVGC